MLLSYRLGLYPSRAREQKLLAAPELCRWLYDRLLKELDRARSENPHSKGKARDGG